MQNRRQVSGSVVDSEPGDTGSNPTVADVISSVHAYKVTLTDQIQIIIMTTNAKHKRLTPHIKNTLKYINIQKMTNLSRLDM